jgi:hypothetical protein
MGGGGMPIGYWWKSHKEEDHWEDQNVGGHVALAATNSVSVEFRAELLEGNLSLAAHVSVGKT